MLMKYLKLINVYVSFFLIQVYLIFVKVSSIPVFKYVLILKEHK